jgi:glycogen debranching enzyme
MPRPAKTEIEIQESFPIVATSSRLDEAHRILKHGESFAVFDRAGEIHPGSEQGLYHEGTRFLSRLELTLENQRPLVLGSTVRQDNALIVELTNPDLMARGEKPKGETVLPRDTIHVFAICFLWEEVCYLRWRIHNFGPDPVELRLELRFGADYADVFEVRGTPRPERGALIDPFKEHASVALGYRGLDGAVRRTRLSFSPDPEEMTGAAASFVADLPPRGEATWTVTVGFQTGNREPLVFSFEEALERSGAQLQARRLGSASLRSSNERFDDWAERSVSDLHMLITETTRGPYPYAGIPWYSTAFGRDGLWTALETLWLDPAPARGVLSYLAATQALRVDSANDAEPGKILHETRLGEMAALGEIPFGRYYGSVDATPLFVVLAGAYLQRTADRAFIESLWPHVERALEWIDVYGDLDGDGFVEYARRSPAGLVHQGWKDSAGSICHADGSQAEGPIALCEVQGYVYAAYRAAARLAVALGLADRAEKLERQARDFQQEFEQAFWVEEIGTYAQALDGEKKPCAVRSSNAGHCLFAGIASPAHARQVAETLMADTSFSRWGIRTLDAREVRYNPLSYHRGSIWPHDNAIIAQGLSRYGFKGMAVQVMSALYDAVLHFDLERMPELFCGFHRRPNEGPTRYPVACAPQAWSAASVFLLLQACLGLEIDAPGGRILLHRPELPDFFGTLRIRNLNVGEASVDLILERHTLDVSLHLERRDGDIEVVMIK